MFRRCVSREFSARGATPSVCAEFTLLVSTVSSVIFAVNSSWQERAVLLVFGLPYWFPPVSRVIFAGNSSRWLLFRGKYRKIDPARQLRTRPSLLEIELNTVFSLN